MPTISFGSSVRKSGFELRQYQYVARVISHLAEADVPDLRCVVGDNAQRIPICLWVYGRSGELLEGSLLRIFEFGMEQRPNRRFPGRFKED
jgi:hypothetical protein